MQAVHMIRKDLHKQEVKFKAEWYVALFSSKVYTQHTHRTPGKDTDNIGARNFRKFLFTTSHQFK